MAGVIIAESTASADDNGFMLTFFQIPLDGTLGAESHIEIPHRLVNPIEVRLVCV